MALDIDKITALLDNLKGLKIKEATYLRKRLVKEKEKLQSPEAKPEFVQPDLFEANRRRSSFMKGVWNYVKLILDTYPDIRNNYTPRQVFKMFFARRRGEQVEINDVYWQNPS